MNPDTTCTHKLFNDHNILYTSKTQLRRLYIWHPVFKIYCYIYGNNITVIHVQYSPPVNT